ncbi:MAG: hypothetical protein WCB31_07505 [Nitrososphaeraceae archaeon]
MSYNNDDKLKEHEIIQKIKDKHDISSLNLTHINGYVADSPIKDCVRLFTTLNFDVCVDIPKHKIIHVEEVSKDRMEFGGTCIWIPKDAELTYTKIERSKIEAQFLEGKIMQDYLQFSKGLHLSAGQQGPDWPITTVPCQIVIITIDLTIIIFGSQHCPSRYATCMSQAGCPTCGPV